MRTLILIAALTLPAGLASAQDTPECRQVRPGLVECSATSIVGRLPRSFYLLSRAQSRYELPPLRRSMAGEVARTVRNEPF